MLIQWVTKNAPTPTVKYGLKSGNYTNGNVVRPWLIGHLPRRVRCIAESLQACL